MPIECKRGEIYWIHWNPGSGSEQQGIRPAVIIQNDIGNKFSSTTIVAACTTTIKRHYPFVVLIKAQESGLDRDCVINLSQLMTIDKSRLGKRCGNVPENRLPEVNIAIKHSLSLYT